MYKCDICGDTFENGKVKSNHVRWKHRITPESSAAFAEKQASRSKERQDLKYGIETEFQVACCQCQKPMMVVERLFRHPMKEHYFCSRTCSSNHSRSFVAPGSISKAMVLWASQRESCARATRTRASSYAKPKPCIDCGTGLPLKTKKRLCASCKEARIASIAAHKRYRQLATFKFSLNSYPNEFDFALIEAHGWYSAKNRGGNLTGVTRDHMYSVAEGFRKGVDPAIVAHPANCKLMLFTDNYRKRGSSSISLETLLERISAWDAKYSTIN